MMAIQLLLFALVLLTGWANACYMPFAERNYAKYSEVSQSSTYGGPNNAQVAERANDGNNDNHYSQNSCTHTELDFEPWFMVDMKKSIPVGVIVITNRADCCKERLLNAVIVVGDSPSRDNPVCGIIDDISSETILICCNGLQGRYIFIYIPERQEYLTLCEMEVYHHIGAPDGSPEKFEQEDSNMD